jgi:phage gp36-like protein
MAAQFCDGSDLVARCDRRAIAELASDTDSSVDDVAITTDSNVLLAIEDAEGEVIANLLAGGRYTVTQLAELTGSQLAFLKRIICEIAMLHLYRRRPSWNADLLTAYEKLAEMYLKKLAKGDAIFGGDDGRLEAARPSVDGPTISQTRSLNYITDRSGYFRRQILPDGRNI